MLGVCEVKIVNLLILSHQMKIWELCFSFYGRYLFSFSGISQYFMLICHCKPVLYVLLVLQ